MKYIASLSGGKDSIAMILKLIKEKKQLDEVIFFDTLWEFNSIYKNIEKIRILCNKNDIKFTIIKHEIDSWYQMFANPVNTRNREAKFGFGWCGGLCRWNTANKRDCITRYLKTNYPEGYKEYVGIAFDEPSRIKDKLYPLVKWQMTEKDCLQYCYNNDYNWLEDGIELYSILDRVSCWCCRNKNLSELRLIYIKLPRYWNKLKGLQSRIKEPFKESGSIFELEERFIKENEQGKLF